MSATSRTPLRSNRSRATLLAATAAAAALTLSACSSGGTSGGGGDTNFVMGKDGIATADKGERADAPDLSGRTVDGKQLDVAAYRGKVVVLNVWGSWCPPCRAEAPGFAKISKELESKGVQFVGIKVADPKVESAVAFV
jgi:thiol-disulfide isomerase/thioredoxin